ncbi:MAG: DMT family transporter [Acidimicrobiales bacterium]
MADATGASGARGDATGRAPATAPDAEGGHGWAGRHPGATLVAAATFWAGGGLIGRAAPMSGTQIAFWRSLFGAVLYQSVLRARGQRFRVAHLRTSLVGGLGFGLSVAFLFVAYKSTTLISANVIGCLQPLVLGFIDHRGGRRLGRVLWAATSAAVAGTILVVVGSSDQTGTWSLRGDLFALAGTGCNVVYVLGTKHARRTLGSLTYQASMLWVAAVVTLPVAWATTHGHLAPAGGGLAWALALVAVGGTGHLLFTAAQRHVSVAASSAILLLEVVLVAIGAAILFDQPIGALQALGMAVVAVAVGVWLARSTEVSGALEAQSEPVPGQG